MPDRRTELRARLALHDLEHGKLQAVADFLAKLGGVPVPELKRQPLRFGICFAPPVVMDARRDREAERARDARSREAVAPLVKPAKRHVARDLLAEFRALNFRCCVLECGQRDADPHHIWKRSQGGSDDASNLIPLCRTHHETWHTLGRDAFVALYPLPETERLKVRLAITLEAEAKRGQREAAEDA